MCGRYKLSTPGDELWESFDIHGEQQIKLQLTPHWNISILQRRHLRVRKHGDLIDFESGPKADPVRHIRLRRATRQWYTLEIATHTGQWQIVPIFLAGARDAFETVVREFPWALVPIA